MTLDEARREFAVRYYRWALSDSVREHEHGFPMLSQIRGDSTRKYLAVTAELSPLDRSQFLAAMVKRAHPDGAALSGEGMSDEERRLIERYRTYGIESDEHAARGPRFNSKKLWGALKRECESIAPGSFEALAAQSGRYRKDMPLGWILLTTLGGGSRPYYWHGIWAREHVPLAEGINICSWLGIASQTRWGMIEGGRETEVARHFALLCAHFLEAVPELLHGLSHDVEASAVAGAAPSAKLAPRLRPRS